MPDPFDALRAPVQPVEPDPAFAARLRARVERALSLPEGVSVSAVTREQPRTARTAVRLTPYLAVADARRALAWYAEVLGARPRGEPIVMPDGRIGHAEIDLGGASIFLSDQHPELGVVAPEPGAGVAVTLHLTVPDVDALTERAVAAAATLERSPGDNPYGRIAVIRDPFGHRWMFNTEPAATDEPMRHGDVAYASLQVPDEERAARFFAATLGWAYAGGGAGGGVAGGGSRLVTGARPAHGLYGGQPRGTLFLCFAVTDLDAAVARVGAAGGRAGEPATQPHGRVADCTDDQGVPFALYEIAAGDRRPPAGGTGPADLAYISLGVADSARARAFYGAVLGWRFRPGHSDDGWEVEDVAPMTGLSGGNTEATAVPMYRVEDIATTVGRVRAAGGTATDPARQPYGVTAECADDQGTRFYLMQA